MPACHPIQVLVAHEDPLTSAGILAALNGRSGIVARSCTDNQTPEHSSPQEIGLVHVIVTDHEHGLAWARRGQCDGRVRATSHVPRVMIVTRCERESEVRQALEVGVRGYLHHGCPLEEIVEGVRMLHRGGRHLGAVAARLIAESFTYDALTCREAEVLRWLAQGLPNKGIANQLGVAVGTVKTHVKAILDKLDARSRTEAAAVAARRGLLEATPGSDHEVQTSSPRRSNILRVVAPVTALDGIAAHFAH